MSAIWITRSNWSASRASWLTINTVVVCARDCANSTSRNATCVAASKDDVGSSATIRGGVPINARAAATRCCCPTLSVPDRAPNKSWGNPRSLHRRSASSTGDATRLARSGATVMKCPFLRHALRHSVQRLCRRLKTAVLIFPTRFRPATRPFHLAPVPCGELAIQTTPAPASGNGHRSVQGLALQGRGRDWSRINQTSLLC